MLFFIPLMLTTGIVLPWIINNIHIPLWLSMLIVGLILCLWVVIAEQFYIRMLKFYVKILLKKQKVNLDDK